MLLLSYSLTLSCSLFLCRLTCCWNRMGKFTRREQWRERGALCHKLWVPSRSAIVVNVTVYCRPLLQAGSLTHTSLSRTPALPSLHGSMVRSLNGRKNSLIEHLALCFNHCIALWSTTATAPTMNGQVGVAMGVGVARPQQVAPCAVHTQHSIFRN